MMKASVMRIILMKVTAESSGFQAPAPCLKCDILSAPCAACQHSGRRGREPAPSLVFPKKYAEKPARVPSLTELYTARRASFSKTCLKWYSVPLRLVK
jgi:hypothetical protein